MTPVSLNWKPFNVNVPMVVDEINKLLESTKIAGTACDYTLNFYFEQRPTKDEIDLINLYWEGITEDSIEATSYKSQKQMYEEQEAKRLASLNSATQKLAALGLDGDEISTLLGNLSKYG